MLVIDDFAYINFLRPLSNLIFRRKRDYHLYNGRHYTGKTATNARANGVLGTNKKIVLGSSHLSVAPRLLDKCLSIVFMNYEILEDSFLQANMMGIITKNY